MSLEPEQKTWYLVLSTGEVLEALQRKHGSRLRVVTHKANRGYGGALRSGFEAATLDYVFYTDGDGQYDVGDLPLLLEAALPRVGLVNGYKSVARSSASRSNQIDVVASDMNGCVLCVTTSPAKTTP